MTDGPTVHTAFLLRAYDAEAELWAQRSRLDAWIAKMTKNERSRALLRRIALQCFVEGCEQGVHLAKSRKALDESIDAAEALKAATSNGQDNL